MANKERREIAEAFQSGESVCGLSYSKNKSIKRTREPLTEEQKKLAEDYMPLAESIARYRFTLSRKRNSYEEYVSEAYFALIQAAESYDGRVKFATFAHHRIKGALIDFENQKLLGYRDRNKESPKTIALELHSEEYGKVLLVEEDLPIGFEIEEKEKFEKLLKKLSKKESKVCRYLYYYCLSRVETSKILGCSCSSVHTTHSRAIAYLKEIMEEDYAAK